MHDTQHLKTVQKQNHPTNECTPSSINKRTSQKVPVFLAKLKRFNQESPKIIQNDMTKSGTAHGWEYQHRNSNSCVDDESSSSAVSRKLGKPHKLSAEPTAQVHSNQHAARLPYARWFEAYPLWGAIQNTHSILCVCTGSWYYNPFPDERRHVDCAKKICVLSQQSSMQTCNF